MAEDPYSLDNRSSMDMTSWPKIENDHAHLSPGLELRYTQQELVTWKQMEAYNYFQLGHMRTVMFTVFGSRKDKCVVLKAKVNPSQRSPDTAYETWVIARDVLCAHCTYMGLSLSYFMTSNTIIHILLRRVLAHNVQSRMCSETWLHLF